MHGTKRAGTTTAGPGGRRRVATMLLVPLLLAVGCSSGDGGAATTSDAKSQPASAKPTPSPVSKAKIKTFPGDGEHGVEPDETVRVKAEGGKLTKVEVADDDGDRLDGKLSADGRSWRAEDELALAETYKVTAVAEDAAGVPARTTSTFRTVKPRKLVRTSVVPLGGETVGVGQPIAVKFTTSIPRKYRADVQKQMKVSSSPAVEGSWYWIDGQRLRYRPKTYWPAGSKVALKIDIKNVKAGDRVYGAEKRTIRFTVARSMVSVVDVAAHIMTVYRDGVLVRTIPISTGKEGFETRGGIKVALSKDQHKVMDSTSIGIPKDSPDYYHLDVYWAVRVTWSGEFVHAAPWSVGAQGRDNVSHGCVGMSTENAQWFFENTIRGDVIDVRGNPAKRMELDNGFGDWNIPWSTWKAGSATA